MRLRSLCFLYVARDFRQCAMPPLSTELGALGFYDPKKGQPTEVGTMRDARRVRGADGHQVAYGQLRAAVAGSI